MYPLILMHLNSMPDRQMYYLLILACTQESRLSNLRPHGLAIF